jgi:hypothetical protein
VKQKTIQFSKLRYEQIPYRVGGVVRVWKKKPQPFFKVLLKDIGKLIKLIVRSYRKDLVVGSVLLLGLFPSPQHVKAAPIPAPTYIHSIARLQPVAAISVPIPPEAAPLPEPQPVASTAPVTASGGCTTGVTAPDYYENLLIQRESGGNSCITNSIGCVGLLQACPGSKLYAVCPTLEVNCQLNFFEGYMRASYGTWANAWAQDEARSPHWW